MLGRSLSWLFRALAGASALTEQLVSRLRLRLMALVDEASVSVLALSAAPITPRPDMMLLGGGSTVGCVSAVRVVKSDGMGESFDECEEPASRFVLCVLTRPSIGGAIMLPSSASNVARSLGRGVSADGSSLRDVAVARTRSVESGVLVERTGSTTASTSSMAWLEAMLGTRVLMVGRRLDVSGGSDIASSPLTLRIGVSRAPVGVNRAVLGLVDRPSAVPAAVVSASLGRLYSRDSQEKAFLGGCCDECAAARGLTTSAIVLYCALTSARC